MTELSDMKRQTPATAHPWLAVAFLLIGQAMTVLDTTVVNIALPSAQRDLHFDAGNRQWVVTAYALAYGSLLLLGGKLSDILGRKTTLILGASGFALSSAAGGASHSFGELIAARAAQGAFSALLTPSVLALLGAIFTDARQRARAYGLYGAVVGAGGAIGLFLGGILTEGLSWRWCLYVNMLFAAVVIVGVAVLVPTRLTPRLPSRIDGLGTFLVTAGLVAVVYGFAHAASAGWSDGVTVVALSGGVVALAIFALVESRSAAPLVPPRILADRTRLGGYLAVATLGGGLYAVFLYLSFFMAQSLGFSPVRTAFGFLPMILVLAVFAAGVSGPLLPRLGPKLLVFAGLATGAVGLFLLSRLGTGSGYLTGVLPGILVAGAGIGLTFPSSVNEATTAVLPEDAGVASALVNVHQQIGAAVGTALLSTLAANALRDSSAGSAAPAALAKAAIDADTTAFLAAAIIFAAGAVVSGLLLKTGPLSATRSPQHATA